MLIKEGMIQEVRIMIKDWAGLLNPSMCKAYIL